MASDPPERLLGFDEAGCTPAPAHVVLVMRRRLSLRLVVRVIEIIDSITFVHTSTRARVPPMPNRRTVNMSSSPSRRLPAASGWVLSSSAESAVALRPEESRRRSTMSASNAFTTVAFSVLPNRSPTGTFARVA